MKKLILFLICMMFLVAPIIAEGEELAFEPNSTMDLKAYCFDVNESHCASGTACQISIFYPNTTVWIGNASMSVTSNYYNYTNTSPDTLGVYKAIIDCNSGADSHGYEPFRFYIGRPSTYVQEKTTSTAMYILFGVAIILFVGFLFVPKEKASFRWTFFLLSVLFIVITINVVSIMLYNEAGNENIRSIFDTLGAICYYMYWFIGGLMLIIWILTTIATLAERKNMRQAEMIGATNRGLY